MVMLVATVAVSAVTTNAITATITGRRYLDTRSLSDESWLLFPLITNLLVSSVPIFTIVVCLKVEP